MSPMSNDADDIKAQAPASRSVLGRLTPSPGNQQDILKKSDITFYEFSLIYKIVESVP